MEEPIMKKFYDFNTKFPQQEISRRKRDKKKEDGAQWAGYNIRMMLLLLYTLAFLCLLRYDEALQIRWSDLILTHVEGKLYCLEVRLPFRKTHQTGGELVAITNITSLLTVEMTYVVGHLY